MLNLFCHTIGVKPLNRSHELSVQCPAPLVEKRVVRHLVRKTMFESIFKLREKVRLVKKLSGLKVNKAAPKFLFRCLNNSLKQGERHALANNGC